MTITTIKSPEFLRNGDERMTSLDMTSAELSYTFDDDRNNVVESDGKGGIYVHAKRMRPGQPYVVEYAGLYFIAVRQGDEVALYDFGE